MMGSLGIRLRGSRLATGIVAVVAMAMAACSDDATAVAPSGDAGTGADGATNANGDGGSVGNERGEAGSDAGANGGDPDVLAVIDGVVIPIDIQLCPQTMSPTVSATKIEFQWSAVPNATRYAVRATKAPTNSENATVVFEGLDTALKFTFDESASGTTYSLLVAALNGSTPLCLLGGVDRVSK
jgi:hypothetical protein